MGRNRFLGGMLAVVVLSSTGFAQEQGEEAKGEGAKIEAARPERHRYISRFSPPKQQVEMLTEELTLDAYQQQQLMPILEEHQRKFQELAKEAEPSPEMEQARRQNRLAYLEARKSGDKELEKKLRDEQIALTTKLAEQILPVQDKLEALQEEMQQNIGNILRPDQKTKFEEVWEGSFGSTPMGNPRSRLRNPQMLLRQVQRLKDLTPAQKTQVDTLFKTYKEAAKATGEDKKAEMTNRRERDSKLYDEVMAVLTESQRKEIDTAMRDQMKGLRRRHTEMGRGTRPGEGEIAKPEATETKPEENKGQ